jgi:hypothetical protein
MNEIKYEKGNKEENSEKRKKREKRVRKTQGQQIQESLGLNPQDIQEVEKKLFIARFLDFFSEDTLEFIFKERIVGQNIERMSSYMNELQMEREEEKLLKQSYDSKNVKGLLENIKNKVEAVAISKGIKNNVNKRLRKLTLVITLPLFALIIIFTFIPIFASTLNFVIFPILCGACIAPQLIRGNVVKKWYRFKEENKDQIYSENRDDIMILKGFTGELLNNIRARLIELEVPLQLIKFTLFSRDYENLELVNQRSIRGFMQYFYTFEYPAGMAPIPIPENLQRYQQQIVPGKKAEKPEKNFIVLAEMKGKDGVIRSFVPTLKDMLAGRINDVLNECKFEKAPKEFKTIIPDYPEGNAIFCVCGEIANISNVQICDWKKQLKFYLFEGEECKCGESIYALSLMDESTDIPDELKDIFLS